MFGFQIIMTTCLVRLIPQEPTPTFIGVLPPSCSTELILRRIHSMYPDLTNEGFQQPGGSPTFFVERMGLPFSVSTSEDVGRLTDGDVLVPLSVAEQLGYPTKAAQPLRILPYSLQPLTRSLECARVPVSEAPLLPFESFLTYLSHHQSASSDCDSQTAPEAVKQVETYFSLCRQHCHGFVQVDLACFEKIFRPDFIRSFFDELGDSLSSDSQPSTSNVNYPKQSVPMEGHYRVWGWKNVPAARKECFKVRLDCPDMWARWPASAGNGAGGFPTLTDVRMTVEELDYVGRIVTSALLKFCGFSMAVIDRILWYEDERGLPFANRGCRSEAGGPHAQKRQGVGQAATWSGDTSEQLSQYSSASFYESFVYHPYPEAQFQDSVLCPCEEHADVSIVTLFTRSAGGGGPGLQAWSPAQEGWVSVEPRLVREGNCCGFLFGEYLEAMLADFAPTQHRVLMNGKEGTDLRAAPTPRYSQIAEILPITGAEVPVPRPHHRLAQYLRSKPSTLAPSTGVESNGECGGSDTVLTVPAHRIFECNSNGMTSVNFY